MPVTNVVTIAGNTRIGQGSPTSGVAGESIAAFNVIYQDGSDSKFYKADNSTAAKAKMAGIAVVNAELDDVVVFITPGQYIESTSGIFVQGKTYVVSDTGGAFHPADEISAGKFVTIVGVAESTTRLLVIGYATGLTG